MPNAIPADSSSPLLPIYHSQESGEECSPINQNLRDVRFTTELPENKSHYWTPLNIASWLAKLFTTKQTTPEDADRQAILQDGQAVRQLAESTLEWQAQRNEPLERPISRWAGCFIAAIAATTTVGALAIYGLRSGAQRAANTPGGQPGGNENMVLPPPPSAREDFPQIAALAHNYRKQNSASAQKKRCHYISKWTQLETIGICPADRKHPHVTPKPKRCWNHSKWTNLDSPYDCPVPKKPSKPHPAQPLKPSCSRMRSDFLQPVMENVACSKDKIAYQYPAVQNEICLKTEFLQRCELAHKEASEKLSRLILPVDNKGCFCPPPQASRGIFDIIPLQLNNNHHYGRVVPNEVVTTPFSTTTTARPRLSLLDWSWGLIQKALSTKIEPDDIKKIALYDFKCIQEREELSLSEWLRTFGKGLERPITALAQESQVVHFHITLGKGCPTDSASQNLEKVTLPIDIVASMILQAFPVAKLYAILQNIVGPLLQQFANYLEGKPIDMKSFFSTQEQIHMMIRDLLPTLTTSETTALYSDPQQPASPPVKEQDIVSKRFTLHDGKPYIKVAGKEYLLHEKPDGTPFIIEDEEKTRVVLYDQIHEDWDFVDDVYELVYSEESKRNRNQYSIELNKNSKITHDNRNIVTVVNPQAPTIHGVFMRASFVPIRKYKIGSSEIVATHSPYKQEQRILIHGAAGWLFEPASTKIDKNLKILLDSKNKGIKFTDDRKFTNMNNLHGLSRDDNGNFFIKYNYHYYKVEPIDTGETGVIIYDVDGYSNARVQYDYTYAKLLTEDNMLFALRSETYTDPLAKERQFYTEKGLKQYLEKNAQPSDAQPQDSVHPGLYRDRAGGNLFVIGDAKYAVSKYEDNHITIKTNRRYRTDDIELWLDKDTWLRKRDSDAYTPDKYEAQVLCRVARAPVPATCSAVTIEASLNELLTKHVNDKTTSNYTPPYDRLVEAHVYDIPFIYQDISTQKYYFRFNDDYFDATIIDAYDSTNPTARPGVRVTAKGNFFTREHFLANIIIEKTPQGMVIKKMETFIAEKLNINTNIATAYIEARPWHTEPGISAVEELVDEIESTSLRFADHSTNISWEDLSDVSSEEEWSDIKNNLYPSRISENSNYHVKTFRLDSKLDTLSLLEQDATRFLKENVNYIHDRLLPSVINALYPDSLMYVYVEIYLNNVLHSEQYEFIDDFVGVLSKRLRRIKDAIKPDKIYLTSAIYGSTTPKDIDINDALLTPEEISSGKMVYVTNDLDRNIYINMDKFFSSISTHQYPDPTLITALLEEVSHLHGMARNIININKYKGRYVHIDDALGHMLKSLQANNLLKDQMEDLREISEPYLEYISGNKETANSFLTANKLAYFFNFDHVYRGHVLLHSDQFLTLIAQDIFHQVIMNNLDDKKSNLDRWIREYDALRAPGIEISKQPLRINLTKQRVNISILVTKDFDGMRYLTEAKKNSNIAGWINQPQGKSEAMAEQLPLVLETNGFTEIRYRAIAMFMFTYDKMPMIHFAVKARMKGIDYIFDLTAGEFSAKYSALDGPLILPEEQWAKKYADISEQLLIKYNDYPTLNLATETFNHNSKFIVYGPEVQIPDAEILKQPGWYFPETILVDTPTIGESKLAGVLGYNNPIKAAVRRNMEESTIASTAWDYVVDILQNAELLSQEPADALRQDLKEAASWQRSVSLPGSLEGLFSIRRPIDDMEKLLRVRQGELLIFMAADPNMPEKGTRPLHVMVSAGNGRFAGIKNGVLNPLFGDGKKILTAEQLGSFKHGEFICRDNKAPPEISLIAATAKNLLISRRSTLRMMAMKTKVAFSADLDIAGSATQMLRESGTFAAEQTIALQAILTPMFNKQEGSGTVGRSIQSLFTRYSRVKSKEDLNAVAKGEMVIFSKPGSNFAIDHMMYSLGRGEFVMVAPEKLDHSLQSENSIVGIGQFPNNVFTQHYTYAGELCLENLRIFSLLGPGSGFTITGKKLTVRAHGGPSNVWYMNAPELVETIKGLGLRESTPVNWDGIDTIELHSCFAAYGSLPTAEVLANLMQKKVVAWPLLFSERARSNFEAGATSREYVPKNNSSMALNRMSIQNVRNFKFWGRLKWLWLTEALIRSRLPRATNAFESMLANVADLANGKISSGQFYSALPLYKSQLVASAVTPDEILQDTVADAEGFAERCMDIINLSKYSSQLLNEYLKEDH